MVIQVKFLNVGDMYYIAREKINVLLIGRSICASGLDLYQYSLFTFQEICMCSTLWVEIRSS